MIPAPIKIAYGIFVACFLFMAVWELDCCRMSLKRNDDATVFHIYPEHGMAPEVLR